MAPIAKEPEAQNSAAPAASPNATQPKVQPVALEIAVTVNGARTVEGSDKREPFSETTQTVLVFGTGAVIRLNSNVTAGQLLFLTNEKTKKEVVCQVVKSKNYRSVSGYVELEFTEPAVGFWGMRFPADRIAAAPATNGGASAPVAPTKAAPAAISKETPAAAIVPPAKSAAPAAPISVVAPPSPAPVAPVNETPAIVEKNAAPVTTDADGGFEELRKQTARLQEQLSSMLFEEAPATKPVQEVPVVGASAVTEASAKVLELAKAEPTDSATAQAILEMPKPAARAEVTPIVPPQKPVGSLHEEEVKIPSWLEPLARNAGATPVPASNVPASVVVSQAPPSLVSFADAPATPVTEDDAQITGEPHDFGRKQAVTPGPEVAEQSAPSFSTDLFSTGEAGEAEATSGGSKKGLWIGLVAATLLAAAGGGWWYLQQSKPASANTETGISREAAPAATNNVEPEQKYLASTSLPPSTKTSATPSPVSASQPAVEKEKPIASPAVEVQKIPSARETRETREPSKPSAAASTTAGKAAEPVEETRKTSFNQMRLAAPKVAGGKATAAPSENEPGIALDNSVSTAAMNSGLASSHGAPTAPVPVGGEVKPVQLVSSVQPVYPQMARSQRISGDVKIDALIDENGRVTGMKVVSGPVLLHQAAMEALRQWKYRPATLDGKAVSMHLVVTIQFRLQ